VKTVKSILIPALMLTALSASMAQAGPLADLYRMAQANDPQLKAAEATFMAGQEVSAQTRSALLPRADLQASTALIDSDTRDVDSSLGYSLSLTQPLYSAASWHTYKRGEILSEQASVRYDLAQQQLILRSIEAYLNSLRAMSRLENARAQERAVQRRLDQVNAQFEVGLIAITDVQDAQASYDNAVVQRIDAESALENSYESLQRLSGQSFTQVQPLREDYPIEPPVPADPAPWLEKALTGNLSIRLSDLTFDAARRDTRSKQAEHYPTVSLQAQHENTRLNGGAQTPRGWNDETRLSLTLAVPLSRGGFTSSAQRQAEQEQLAAMFNREDSVRGATEAIRSLLRTLQNSVQSVQAREQSILSRQTALNATEEGFNVGTRNVVDVLLAEQRLFEAQLEYAEARFNYILALFQFKQQVGTLSPEDLYALDEWLQSEG